MVNVKRPIAYRLVECNSGYLGQCNFVLHSCSPCIIFTVQSQNLIAFKRSSYATTVYPVTKPDAASFSPFKSDGYSLKYKNASLSVYLFP